VPNIIQRGANVDDLSSTDAVNGHCRGSVKRLATIASKHLCTVHFQFVHPDVSTYEMWRAVYEEFQALGTTMRVSNSCGKEGGVVNNAYTSQLSQPTRERQIDNLVVFILDSAAECQYESSSSFDPGAQSC